MTSSSRSFTIDQALKQDKPTTEFLCPLEANSFGVEFLTFTIRDLDQKKTLFDVHRDIDKINNNLSIEELGDDAVRFIRYDFNADFLKCKAIGTSLSFAVGEQPLQDFRMVEKHYFRDRLIKTFDFKFGFCIPNSTNTWEVMYELPKLSHKEEEDILSSPYETKSDSFYFADGKLIMHNKAEYAYRR